MAKAKKASQSFRPQAEKNKIVFQFFIAVVGWKCWYIDIFVNSFDPSSINIGYRVWTKTENYWTLRWQLMEEVKKAFDENEIVIPFDQLDVQIKNQE